jgi:micrococcal nuclease
MNKKIKLIIIISFTLLFIFSYSYLDNLLIKYFKENEIANVERVIDGDTIVANGKTIRLLGINTPEKKEIYYENAKNFLEYLILNKSVILEFGKEKIDKYNRTLAYVFLENKNINEIMIQEGFANIYFLSGKDKYYNDFLKSWENCIKRNINLCEISNNQCSKCIILKKFEIKKQELILENICNFDCDLSNWTIKNEGRKKFIFDDFILEKFSEINIKVGQGINNQKTLYWIEKFVWTEKTDSIFLRDAQNKLVLWENY